jgi:hypothetical protein
MFVAGRILLDGAAPRFFCTYSGIKDVYIVCLSFVLQELSHLEGVPGPCFRVAESIAIEWCGISHEFEAVMIEGKIDIRISSIVQLFADKLKLDIRRVGARSLKEGQESASWMQVP